MTRKHRSPLAALLIALAVVATATIGSAATLTVNAASISTFTVTHPCPGDATAVPDAATGTLFTGVTVTLPSAACSGRVVQVTVLDGTTVVAQGEATAADATATVTGLTAYTAQAAFTVQATVGGWHLKTTWSYTPPFTPGSTNTVIESVSWEWPAANQVCGTVVVTTNTDVKSWWSINLNVAAAPFNGLTSTYTSSGQVRFVPSATPVNGVIGIEGSNPGHGNLRIGQSTTFTVCLTS